MKIKRDKTDVKGVRVVTVELSPGETLCAFNESTHYRLGGQIDDIVPGFVITESYPAHWCHIEQAWVSSDD